MSLNLDKFAWKRVAFGDVVRNANETVRGPAATAIDRIIAMEHMDPGELEVRRWGSLQDGTTFTRRVKPGQTLFGKRRAYQRKVAYAQFDAICSGDIYTFEADETQMVPGFLPFLVQSNEFFDHALGTSAGSLSPRTNWRDLAGFEFDLPPLTEQQRIADLLWAVETHRNSLKIELAAASVVLSRLLQEHFENTEGVSSRIVDLCLTVVGGVWGSPEGENEVDVLALGPRVYAGGATEVTTEGSPVRSISQKQASSRLITENDIILERSGGSPDQPVGRVVIAGTDLPPCIPTDFQRLLRPNSELVEPRYLFWKLRLDWLDGLTRSYSKRTTNIANLSVPDYLAREFVVPTRQDQAKLLAEAQALESALSKLTGEVTAVDHLRSSLLNEIFGGNR